MRAQGCGTQVRSRVRNRSAETGIGVRNKTSTPLQTALFAARCPGLIVCTVVLGPTSVGDSLGRDVCLCVSAAAEIRLAVLKRRSQTDTVSRQYTVYRIQYSFYLYIYRIRLQYPLQCSKTSMYRGFTRYHGPKGDSSVWAWNPRGRPYPAPGHMCAAAGTLSASCRVAVYADASTHPALARHRFSTLFAHTGSRGHCKARSSLRPSCTWSSPLAVAPPQRSELGRGSLPPGHPLGNECGPAEYLARCSWGRASASSRRVFRCRSSRASPLSRHSPTS